MGQSYQFYSFMLSTTILFTDIRAQGDFSHNWFDAQEHCLGQGLTIEENKSNQPYWTGFSRRLSPWINILGCYSDSIEQLPTVVKKTMIISSVGMCQELCSYENCSKFAVKMNNCLCIEVDVYDNRIGKISSDDCHYTCGDSDDIYSRECGGESAYNLFEIQGVKFNSLETCLSLQCSMFHPQFIPKNCSEHLERMCEYWEVPDNGYASSWSSSMEQCKNSDTPYYLLGDIRLNYPYIACIFSNYKSHVFWVGAARQVYTSIDQGLEIQEDQRGTFLECQMCTEKDCRFRRCSDLLNSSIYCNSTKSHITGHLTTSQGRFSASTFMSNHLTSEELFASTASTRYYATDPSPSTNYTLQMSSASDEIALKISLPVIVVFIIILLCAMAVVFYSRRRKMIKADRTTKAQEQSGTRKDVDSDVDYVQNNSYFLLEQCPQYTSKGSVSSNESPYNNSEEGVYDHLRDKISRKPEVEDTYQHASAGVSSDMSEYDTMANAVNKKQEKDDSYDYSHQDTNGNYACDLCVKNNLTDNPYDVAV